MEISFESNIREWSRTLPVIAKRQVAYATNRALNDTAFEVRKETKSWMEEDFQSPTRWTLNSFNVLKSTKKQLIARVLLKDWNYTTPKGNKDYIRTQVHGGRRPHTLWEKKLIRAGVMASNEYAVPGRGLKLTKHGNVPNALYPKIIAQLKLGNAGIGNESKNTRKFRVAKNKAIFVPQFTRDLKPSRLPRGIWMREGKRIKPLFIFVKRAPTYEVEHFDFFWLAEEHVIKRFPVHFSKWFGQAMATAR